MTRLEETQVVYSAEEAKWPGDVVGAPGPTPEVNLMPDDLSVSKAIAAAYQNALRDDAELLLADVGTRWHRINRLATEEPWLTVSAVLLESLVFGRRAIADEEVSR